MQEMSLAEDKLVDEISALIPNAFNRTKSDAPVVWAALWTVILVYREALLMFGSNARLFKSGFDKVSRHFLEALVVILGAHFRTTEQQKALDNADGLFLVGRQDLCAAYASARSGRQAFCKY
jgi:hypothetical protein